MPGLCFFITVALIVSTMAFAPCNAIKPDVRKYIEQIICVHINADCSLKQYICSILGIANRTDVNPAVLNHTMFSLESLPVSEMNSTYST